MLNVETLGKIKQSLADSRFAAGMLIELTQLHEHALEVGATTADTLREYQEAVFAFVVASVNLTELVGLPDDDAYLGIRLPKRTLANVLCSAVEGGGVNHWCAKVEYSDVDVPGVEGAMRRHLQPLHGGSIKFQQHRGLGGNWQTLDGAALRRGVQVIATQYPHHLGAVFGSNQQDALTGDILVQCSIFGSIEFK